MLFRSHHLPLSTHRPTPGRGRLLLAGDAQSLINPFTGEGIFYAVVSGSLAGAAAAAPGNGVARRYGDSLRRRLGRHLRHSRMAARLTGSARVVDATMRQSVNAGFDGAILRIARTWKYRPAMKDGVPVRYVKILALVP